MMSLRQLVVLGCLLAAAAAPTTAQENRGPFQEIPSGRETPREHWVYIALDQAERAGVVTGFPDGAFRNNRRYTRYELAVAVQRVAQTVSRPEQGMAAGTEGLLRQQVLRKLSLTPSTQVPELARLITEFSAELRLLGGDPQQLQRQITGARAEAPAPAAPIQAAPRSKEYARGAQQAHADWEKGETALYSGGLSPALTVDAKLGIPLYFALGCISTPEQREFAQGHNEEVYRLILDRGLPSNHRSPWLPEILEPRQLLDDAGRTQIRLTYEAPTARSPEGKTTLRLKPMHDELPPRLEITEGGSKPVVWNLYRLDRLKPTVTALWGPDGSHLLFIGYHEAERGPGGAVYQVIDTALGRPLNRVYDPDAAPQLPGAESKKE